MNDDVAQERPHRDVMPRVQRLAVAEQMSNPTERQRLPRALAGAFGIEREAGEDQENHRQREHEERRDLIERVGSDTQVLPVDDEQIVLELMPRPGP